MATTSNGAYAAVDVTDPTATLTTPPDGAIYPIGRAVVADFACTDEAGGSGIATCVGTVADGQAINTSALGDHDFTVTAADVAGNTTEVTHTYTVTEGRPDARIRRGTGATIGNDIYGPSHPGPYSEQTVVASVRPGGSVTYWVTIQNDATFAERLRLHGYKYFAVVAVGIRFSVRFYNPAGQDITRPVVAGTKLTPRLNPGQIYRVRMVVTIPRVRPVRVWPLPVSVTAMSTSNPLIRDTVTSKTRRA